jgi:hypothetical protein
MRVFPFEKKTQSNAKRGTPEAGGNGEKAVLKKPSAVRPAEMGWGRMIRDVLARLFAGGRVTAIKRYFSPNHATPIWPDASSAIPVCP